MINDRLNNEISNEIYCETPDFRPDSYRDPTSDFGPKHQNNKINNQ